jgi:CubicO group peptidase (beta-lactamase class C family)
MSLVTRARSSGRHRAAGLLVLALVALPVAVDPEVPARRRGSGVLDVRALNAFVAGEVRRSGLPGLAIGVVDGDRVVDVAGFGRADETGRPVTPETPFLLASVSKPLTATAVLQLVDAGRVQLDVPVRRYVPEFRMADSAAERITVRQLLQHTSGIPNTSCDSRQNAATIQEYVAELRTIHLAAAPGTRHIYCSGNYNVLGRMVEVVTGESFGGYMQRHVFAPLEMRNAFTSAAAGQRAGVARGHRWLFGVVRPRDARYDPAQLPSGYLMASAEDMAHFLVAQQNGGRYRDGRILSPTAVAAMQEPGVPAGAGGVRYGLGWQQASLGGVPTVQHAGDNYYGHGIAFLQPGTRRGAVILSNGNGVLPRAAAFAPIEAGVARILAGQQAPLSGLGLRGSYLILDVALGALLLLALMPLLRLRRWGRRLRDDRSAGRTRTVRTVIRGGLEIALPVAVLATARLLLHVLGAQSWAEGLAFFPDTGPWLWAVCLVVMVTGVLRLTLARTVGRRPTASEVSEETTTHGGVHRPGAASS